MALTLTEINLIYKGQPKPEYTSLRDLVLVAGTRHYNWFMENEKPTDPETLARGYADKMRGITRQLCLLNLDKAKDITYNLIVLSGNTLNYVDVLSYETGDWEALVNNNIVTALEVVAGITDAEKTAYNGL